MLKLIADYILKVLKWRIETPIELKGNQYVVIGAPHTSNWDLIFALLYFFSTKTRMRWIAKKQLFFWPLKPLLKGVGGIAVDRKTTVGFVAKMAENFKHIKPLYLCIAPEGTRSKTAYWKTGFYYIALNAHVPICLGYINYANCTLGIGKVIIPSGDITQDFKIIQQFYQPIKGKYPEKHSEIKIRQSK